MTSQLLNIDFRDILIQTRGNPTMKNGAEWRWGSKGSFVANVEREIWCDHENGVGGGFTNYVKNYYSSKDEAEFKTKRGWILPQKEKSDLDDEIEKKRRRAYQIWDQSKPISDTLAEIYLRKRRIKGPIPSDLRFHSNCPMKGKRVPALVAPMRDVKTNNVKAIHRTAINPDGTHGERMMLGGSKGCAIKLNIDEEVTNGLGIAEGLETALSVLDTGWAPVWALGSCGAIKNFQPLEGIECLTIFADHDDAGLAAAKVCAENWSRTGKIVDIVSPRIDGDFNDLLRKGIIKVDAL